MLELLVPQEAFRRLQARAHPTRSYAAMYSSWLGGIVTDPSVMVIPVDDHGFHRGDAVFEAVKCVASRLYALDPHLERLRMSADRIALSLPLPLPELRDICLETVRVSGCPDAVLRLYVSRGPGGFTANPYESVGAQVYVVVTPFTPPSGAKYEEGVSAKISAVRVKEPFFANVKSCNYLPNVLMKKEAVDAGVDFTVSIDEHGFLAEGSTENFAILDGGGALIVPGFDRTLKGITVSRAMELVRASPKESTITDVRHGHFTREDVFAAREAFVLGTTLDCIAVTSFEGRPIGEGRAGPAAREILALLRDDMRHGTPVTRAR